METGYQEQDRYTTIIFIKQNILHVKRMVHVRSGQVMEKSFYLHYKYILEGLMLKLKLQYFGHLMLRTDSLEKTLTLGKIEGGRRRGQQRMR